MQWTFLLLALALALSLTLSLSLSLVVGFLVINAFGFGQVKWQRGNRHEAGRISVIKLIFDLLLIYLFTLVLSWTLAVPCSLLFSPLLSLFRSEECTHKKKCDNGKKKMCFYFFNLIARVYDSCQLFVRL